MVDNETKDKAGNSIVTGNALGQRKFISNISASYLNARFGGSGFGFNPLS